MNGLLYSPILSCFFSPDNYVQLLDNSQSFNRYSYCLNNPLKYTDPSGELFGIDDAIFAFALFGVANSMMQAAYDGKNVLSAGLLSLGYSAATYGIGSLLGNVGGLGRELLRAGMHGLAGGLYGLANNEKFGSSFLSGALSSGIGSFAQGVHINGGLMIASTTTMGGLAAWVTGGDFLQGAMQGMTVGLFNHSMHDDNDVMGVSAKCTTLPDGTRVAPSDLEGITVIGKSILTKGKFNVDAAVVYLNGHAYAYFIRGKCGHCAKAVRLALDAGGINTDPHPLSAKNYEPYLKKWGFTEITKTDYIPMKGDIRVFQNYPNGTPHGHIDMYNGENWVSDFIEKGNWPGNNYQKYNTPFSIFRW